MKGRAIYAAFVLTLLASYGYVFFEWLFLVTQRGFMASFGHQSQATALAITPLVLLLPSACLTVVLAIAEPLAGQRTRMMSVGPSAVILSSLVLLLFDNFTYTVLGAGIVTIGPLARFFYIPVLLALPLVIGRRLAKVATTWSNEGVPRPLTLCAALLVVCSLGACAMRLADGRLDDHGTTGTGTGNAFRPWNVLLVTIDGIEARRTSAYGYARQTTPFLDEFRHRALVFENAFSNAGRTTGSITAILTSKPPSVTKVLFPPHILTGNDAFQHLPGELRRAGYETHQFSVRYYADGPDLNMRESFDYANGREFESDRWRALRRRFPAELYFAERLWERVTERLLYLVGVRAEVNHSRLVQLPTSIYGDQSDRQRVDGAVNAAQNARRPFFIHVHLMGTHCCGYSIRRHVFSQEGRTEGADVFDDALLQADEEVRRLIAALERIGRLRDTVIVITSDHTATWGTRERVPLLLYSPDLRTPEEQQANVQLIDIAPTILDTVGLPQPSWMYGSSLLRQEERPQYIESIGEIEKEVVGANWERISKLRDPSPPRYGLSVIGAVTCDKWLEVDVNTRQLRTGLVDGHTAPCAADQLPTPAAIARELLVTLQKRGFDVPALGDGLPTNSSTPVPTDWIESPQRRSSHSGALTQP